MDKIAIIGSPGAGKTTLANTLHQKLKIKVYHLDRLLWETGWQSIDGPTRVDTIQKIVLEKQWIIEGTYIRSSEPRLNAADTIIFLDTHPLKCLWRVIKRHYKERGHSRRDIPEGCVDRLSLPRIWKLLTFPIQERTRLKHKLRNYKSIEIIWLRSQKDLEGFLAQPRLRANKMETFSPEKRQLSDIQDLLSSALAYSGQVDISLP